MKKLALLVLLVLLPVALFADFYLGPTAMYKGNPRMFATSLPDSAGDFAFGAEARLTFSLLEAQAMALYNLNRSFNTYLDVGLVLNIAIVSVGVGVGPNFSINFMPAAPETASFGFNAKAHADLNLGGVKISGYYMIILESLSVAEIRDSLTFGTAGLSLLFRL